MSRRRRPTPRRPLLAAVVPTALVALVALAAAGCGGSGAGGTGGPVVRVVAGEDPWGEIAAQIGGSHVSVTSIIHDPSVDPHEYEADPADAVAVARARLVIENGAGYDDFLTRLVSAAGDHPQVLDVQRLANATGANPNPHFWYSPQDVTAVADAVASQLSADDPVDAPTFRVNLAAFRAAYAPYEQVVAQIRARYAGTRISYTERVPGYLTDAAGLVLGTPAGFSQAVEDGTDPTPADTAAFDADIRTHTVRVLLFNSQVVDAQTSHLRALATAAGVPVVGVSETIPAGFTTFQGWQIAQARALLAALGG